MALLEDRIRRADRKLSPFHPTRDVAVIFWSGWEDMHEVEKITSEVRFAVPAFFTDVPRPRCGVRSNGCQEAEHRRGHCRQLAPPADSADEG